MLSIQCVNRSCSVRVKYGVRIALHKEYEKEFQEILAEMAWGYILLRFHLPVSGNALNKMKKAAERRIMETLKLEDSKSDLNGLTLLGFQQVDAVHKSGRFSHQTKKVHGEYLTWRRCIQQLQFLMNVLLGNRNVRKAVSKQVPYPHKMTKIAGKDKLKIFNQTVEKIFLDEKNVDWVSRLYPYVLNRKWFALSP